MTAGGPTCCSWAGAAYKGALICFIRLLASTLRTLTKGFHRLHTQTGGPEGQRSRLCLGPPSFPCRRAACTTHRRAHTSAMVCNALMLCSSYKLNPEDTAAHIGATRCLTPCTEPASQAPGTRIQGPCPPAPPVPPCPVAAGLELLPQTGFCAPLTSFCDSVPGRQRCWDTNAYLLPERKPGETDSTSKREAELEKLSLDVKSYF